MVRRWHCHKLSLAFQSHDRQTQDPHGAPRRISWCLPCPALTLRLPRMPRMSRALRPVLRHTLRPVLLGGRQDRVVEEGHRAGDAAQGARIRGVTEAPLGDNCGGGCGGAVAAAAVCVPRAEGRPCLELHRAGGQAVVAESVVSQVVD